MQTRGEAPATRPTKSDVEPDNEEQSRLFIEKAREIEADEDRSAADDLLSQMARMPPEPRKRSK